MCARIYHFLTYFAVGLAVFTGCTRDASALIPLPTVDLKRIGESMKNAKTEVDFWKKEIEANLQIVKMIQNGGYSEAAGALFAKVDDKNSGYNRYGEMLDKTQKAMEQGAFDAQYAFANREKKLEMLKEQADKELKEKLEAAQKAKESADAAYKAATKEYVKFKVDEAEKAEQNRGANTNSSEILDNGGTVFGGASEYNSIINDTSLTDEQKNEQIDKLKSSIVN